MKKRFFFLAVICALSLSSCKEPEPEPIPDPTPVVRTPVTVSLGETKKMTAGTLFGAEIAAKLTPGAGDNYFLDFVGEGFELVADPLKDYDGSKMFSRFVGLPLNADFKLANKPSVSGSGDEIDLSALLAKTLTASTSSKRLTYSFGGFPAALTELEAVHLTDDSVVEIEVSMANSCLTGGKVKPVITADLSALFGFREAKDGILSFEVELTPENGWTVLKTFHPETFSVKKENYSATTKSVRVDLGATAKAVVTHEGLKTTKARLAAAPAKIVLNVTAILKKVEIGGFTGKFDYKIKDNSASVNLSALTAKIGQTDNSLESLGLNPAAGTVALDVESTFPVETDAQVGVTAKKSRLTVGNVEGISLVIPAKAEDGAAKAHYDLSKLDDISPLLSKVASEMVFTAGAKSKDAVCTFPVGAPVKATFVPSVSIPLCFGSALDFTAEDRFDLPQSVPAALKGGSLALEGKMVNGFPVSLTAALVVVDGAGNAVTDEVSQSFPSERESDVKVTFKSKAGASLENAKAVVIKYKVKGVDGSRPIKATDYIQATLNATISYAN